MKKLLSLGALLLMLIAPGFAYAQVSAQITVAPPALPEEAIPAPPGPSAEWVWHRSHWRWIDGRYMLVPGHWAHRPRPAAVWVEPAWQQGPGGWVFVEGHWR